MMSGHDSSAWAFRFRALDTWFFRDARPGEASTWRPSESLFPPTVFTMAGAIRSAIRQTSLSEVELAQVFEAMTLRGCYVTLGGARIFQVPAFLRQSSDAISYLRPPGNDTLVDSDAQRIRYPACASSAARQVPEGTWLKAGELVAALESNTVYVDSLIPSERLFAREVRMGIRRGPFRTAVEGQLYQVEHLRPADDLEVVALLSRVPECLSRALSSTSKSFVVRFGGEGRLATVQVETSAVEDLHVRCPAPPTGAQGLSIVFTTPLLYRHGFDEAEIQGDWRASKGFSAIQSDAGTKTWRTRLMGALDIEVISAVQGRLEMESVWASGRKAWPERKSQACLPAGTTWFCKLLDNGSPTTDRAKLQAAASLLNGKQLGADRRLGRGEMAVGYW